MADTDATTAPPPVPAPPPRSSQHEQTPPVIDRIERALDRIEAASKRRADHGARMEQRHTALRKRMTEAVAAIDTILAAEATEADEPEGDV